MAFDLLRCCIISLFDIILCTCIDMRLGMSKGLTRGDRPCWEPDMIIWAREDRPCNRRVMIMIWERGGRPCVICLIYDSALRSSAQTRGDRPCRYMDLASPPWVMTSWCTFEAYYVYTVDKVLDILRHITTWYHVALHFIPSLILDDYMFVWCLGTFIHET